MKYRRETIAEEGWDASSRRTTSGRDLGRNPRTGALRFSMLKVGVVLPNKILLGHEMIWHSL
jgi:hypothetical protein